MVDLILSPGSLKRATPSVRFLRAAARFSDQAGFDAELARLSLTPRSAVDCWKPIMEQGKIEDSYHYARFVTGSGWPGFVNAVRLARRGDYMEGYCHYLALALHRRHGWPMEGCICRDLSDEAIGIWHVWAKPPGIEVFDIEGAKTLEGIRATYLEPAIANGAKRIAIEPLTEPDLLRFYHDPDNGEAQSWERPLEWEAWVMDEATWLAAILDPMAQRLLPSLPAYRSPLALTC